jgi:NAD(P)-dependent dehydrogenase (short-subunit alcohol dehydrogenase family)
MTAELSRTTALVTGGTGGIGFHTAAALARAGMRVVVTGRDAQRGQRAVAQLKAQAGHTAVELIIADALLVRDNLFVAQEAARRVERIDVLINNVGGAGFVERQETPERLEATLALNFVGPVALTTELLRILPAPPKRVVNVVSSAFKFWRRDPFDDLQGHRDYIALHAYGHAKLLNLLSTMALARRLARTGTVVAAVNPGMAWTPGIAALTPRAVPHWRYVWPLVRWMQRRASAESASRSVVALAAVDKAPLSGTYYDGRRQGRLPAALCDTALQDRAGTVGESLVSAALDVRCAS